ncbi:murein transglycosylase A [Sulfurimonas sp.]|jgi:membrane-bound lytic murein transglycosylase A|uniref:murein transglycosylase A n=1 Tax=Sulfurimonas sp. TaxID=2022749 RepID=UPI0025DAE59D|nr:murein transglycosylase A [Sulfurimonas sp.]MCK9473004.1 murein transglycosylase A [Sulfurimonas sp.]
MKHFVPYLSAILLFVGCSKQPSITFSNMSETHLLKSDFSELPNWQQEDYTNALESFTQSCKTAKTREIYKDLCMRSADATDAKEFLTSYFTPYKISLPNDDKDGLLTGYYEPEIKGSLTKKEPYVYPVYTTPKDLVVIDLSQQYPELKNYRLRGRVVGNRVVPYYDRKNVNITPIDSEVLCYTDSKIDLFFLEVQGSGRVTLDDGSTIFVGYDNQNGYQYSSIGKYLVSISEIPLEKISLQSIKAWLEQNPSRIDEVLNYNKSMVFFRQKDKPASGSLGVVLTPKRSIAVDRRYIPLGSMLYLSAKTEAVDFNHVVMAQDTGGAIKGTLRADIFMGYGEEAKEIAGELKAPLKLWILLPKESS